jgi:hypothetical protein
MAWRLLSGRISSGQTAWLWNRRTIDEDRKDVLTGLKCASDFLAMKVRGIVNSTASGRGQQGKPSWTNDDDHRYGLPQSFPDDIHKIASWW